MKPIAFDGSNRDLQKPMDWDSEMGECTSLPIFADGDFLTISCWKMTWKERLSALFNGRVWLWVVGGGVTQPPVSLICTKQINL